MIWYEWLAIWLGGWVGIRTNLDKSMGAEMELILFFGWPGFFAACLYLRIQRWWIK